MVVYIEYAFIENFLIDFVLLCLSLIGARRKIRAWNLCFSSTVGGVFALLFPLLPLPNFLSVLLKTAVGLLLCLLAFGRIKNKNDGGRYAFSCALFFSFTAFFAGALIAIGLTGAFIWLGVAFLSIVTFVFIKKIRKKRIKEPFLYPCTIHYKQEKISVLGFYDSGNFASFQETPVCFVSPEIAFRFYEKNLFKEGGQVRDEIVITTLNGNKKTRVYEGGLEIEENGKIFVCKRVYFAVATNMLSREYKVLLNSRIFEERAEK